MRVLVLTSSLRLGGAEIALMRLAEDLLRHGVDIQIAALSGGNEVVARAPALEDRCHVTDLRRPTVAFPALFQLIRRFRPNILHGWMYHGCLAASILAHASSVRPKVVWSVHSSLDSLEGERQRTQQLIRALGRYCSQPDLLHYVSAKAQQQHKALGYRGRIEAVIPNGLDVTAFALPPAPRSDEKVRILFLGRNHPIKNIPLLLSSARVLNERGLSFQLIIQGPGFRPVPSELSLMVAQFGLAHAVEFRDATSEVATSLAEVDLFVLPSLSEAFPTVLCEALAAGIPCVVTDVGDSADIVGPFGKVVTSGDIVGLAEALWSLSICTAAERHQIGCKGRASILERFHQPVVTARWIAAYSDLTR